MIEGKRVTWAELFFDLVFVLAITQLSARLHDDHDALGVVRAAILFVPIYWAWVGTTIHANTHDVDNPVDRLGIFTVGLGALFMALSVPAAFSDRGVLFGASYLAMRAVLAALVFRSFRFTANAFSVALFITGPLLVLGAFVDADLRTLIWAAAALIDLSVPAVLRGRLIGVRFDHAHLPERFGLFLIIALGESIVAVGAPAAQAEDLAALTIVAVAAAFVLACALWWVYFHFAASAVEHALATAAVQTDVVRRVLSYGHLAFICAVIAIAVGLGAAISHPDEALPGAEAALLFGGCALYLATFGYTRWAMFRQVSVTRLSAAAGVIVLSPLSLVAPAVACVGALGVAVGVLNAYEYRAVSRRQELPD